MQLTSHRTSSSCQQQAGSRFTVAGSSARHHNTWRPSSRQYAAAAVQAVAADPVADWGPPPQRWWRRSDSAWGNLPSDRQAGPYAQQPQHPPQQDTGPDLQLQEHQQWEPLTSSWRDGYTAQQPQQGTPNLPSSGQHGPPQPPPPPCPPSCGSPEWKQQPAQVLPHLAQQHTASLGPDPPLDVASTSPAVRLHLQQAKYSRSNRNKPSDVVLLGMMFRLGLQRHSSMAAWMEFHQSRGDGTYLVSVKPTPEAQAAARADVAAGRVTVGEGDSQIVVPASWAPAPQPAGCVVVTLHQLPMQYATQGVGVALLAAAGQQGHVVAEFLGGSKLMGNARLSCPAADTVVLWVKPPADDPLLTRLPTAFDPGLSGEPLVTIQVAGRPSRCPHIWAALTQQHIRSRQSVLDCIIAAVGTRNSVEPPQPPPQQPPQQPQQQQGQSQGPTPPGEQQMPAPLRPQPPHGQQLQAAVLRQPAPQPQQQPRLPPTQQQQRDGDSASAMQLDPQADSAAQLPNHLFPWEQDSLWEQAQQEAMMELANTMAKDIGERSLSGRERQSLPTAFRTQFAVALRGRPGPSHSEVRAWLMQRLRLQDASYGSGSDSGSEDEASDMDTADEGGAPAAPVDSTRQQRPPTASQQQQPQQGNGSSSQQRQPPTPSRRTPRATAGQMTPEFEAMWCPGRQRSGSGGNKQRRGRKGKGKRQQASGAGTEPSTQAATHTPQRTEQRAQGPS